MINFEWKVRPYYPGNPNSIHHCFVNNEEICSISESYINDDRHYFSVTPSLDNKLFDIFSDTSYEDNKTYLYNTWVGTIYRTNISGLPNFRLLYEAKGFVEDKFENFIKNGYKEY